MTYCVACGRQQDGLTGVRCRPCKAAFDEGGGIQKIYREQDRRGEGGIKLGYYEYRCTAPAKYCLKCGNETEEHRRRFALRHGGECLQCDPCRRGYSRA